MDTKRFVYVCVCCKTLTTRQTMNSFDFYLNAGVFNPKYVQKDSNEAYIYIVYFPGYKKKAMFVESFVCDECINI